MPKKTDAVPRPGDEFELMTCKESIYEPNDHHKPLVVPLERPDAKQDSEVWPKYHAGRMAGQLVGGYKIMQGHKYWIRKDGFNPILLKQFEPAK